MDKLKKVKCFILDMDGTIYLSSKLIDGSLDFLSLLEKQGKDFLFLTNNSSKNKKAYKEKLANLGCYVEEDKVFTSGEATTIYLSKEKAGAKVFLLGNEYLEEEFMDSGFTLIKDRSEIPDFVVLGFDTTLTYEKVWIACDHIVNGIPYIATHPDINCPLAGGKYMPDTGAMIKMIEASTGKTPFVIGKPNKQVVDSIIEKYGLERDELAMVGDRLYTDVKLGINSGIVSILVLSGETTKEDVEKSDFKPDYVFDSVKEIKEAIE
jgi:HAD superfamily hydrolase (TIGR01457 family)